MAGAWWRTDQNIIDTIQKITIEVTVQKWNAKEIQVLYTAQAGIMSE